MLNYIELLLWSFKNCPINFLHTSEISCWTILCTWLVVSLQADYEKRFLQLCDEGCKADISQFRELLMQGLDVNIYAKVCVCLLCVYG